MGYRLWFGKHKGKDLEDVPTDYLRWLDAQPWLKHSLMMAVRFELARRGDDDDRRSAEAYARLGLDLPEAPARVVEGIFLPPIAAGRFEEAVEAGELVITNDLPLSSPLPEAWRRWCLANGRPARIREDCPA